MKSCQLLRFFSLFLMVLGLAGTVALAEEKPAADADLARWIDKRVDERQPPAADKRFDEREMLLRLSTQAAWLRAEGSSDFGRQRVS